VDDVRLLAVVAVLAVVATVAAGCSQSAPADASAPVLTVATGLYPVAQAIEQIGQSKVTVTDVVPDGSDPTTYRLGPDQALQVRQAGLVVEVGGGFQPSFEGAAAGAPDVLQLQGGLKAPNPYVWLDPNVMQKAVALIAGAMEAADPAAAGLFRQGEQAYAAAVQSTGIDYQSTLSACPRMTIFTADAAFATMADDYGLRDVVLGPSSGATQAAIRRSADTIQTVGATTVFSEPWQPEAVVDTVAEAAHVKVRSLDTLAGPPAGGWPRQADYINLMESDLGALSSALGCPNTATGND
jgi:ABC-type Zn uptake system ZnuABC Zn-binding protein ZnuA